MAASPEEMGAGVGMAIQGGGDREMRKETDQRQRHKDPKGGQHRGTQCQDVRQWPQGWRLEMQEQGDRQSPQSLSPSLLPAPNPLNPHPEQDAVSMTTWPARKGGRGLQRKFSTAGREEGVKQRRKWPVQWGSRKASGTPNHCAHCPQDCHPTPTQQTCTLTSGPLLGRGKA